MSEAGPSGEADPKRAIFPLSVSFTTPAPRRLRYLIVGAVCALCTLWLALEAAFTLPPLIPGGTSPALGPLLAVIAVLSLANAWVEFRHPRTGRVGYVIAEVGITWWGRGWRTLWRWKPVWQAEWAQIDYLTATPDVVFVNYTLGTMARHGLFAPGTSETTQILIGQCDVAPDAVLAQVRACAPHVQIRGALR